MKKLKSPIDVHRSFADGTVLELPAGKEIICSDEKALEMKRIYPFIEMSEVVEESLESKVKEEETEEETEEEEEETKGEIEETEGVKETEKPKKRGRPRKK